MINSQIEINGNMEDVQLFENMFEYVSWYGSDISHYVISRDSETEFIIGEECFTDDTDFKTSNEFEIDGYTYIRVNWGEEEISLIKESGLDQTLYSIYQKTGNSEYQNYRSLVFNTEEDAQKKVDELNEGEV